jgi:hypothetical protein
MLPPLLTLGRVFRHILDDDHVSLFVPTPLLVFRSETAFAIVLRRPSITNAWISRTKINMKRVSIMVWVRVRVSVRVRVTVRVTFRVRLRIRVTVRVTFRVRVRIRIRVRVRVRVRFRGRVKG